MALSLPSIRDPSASLWFLPFYQGFPLTATAAELSAGKREKNRERECASVESRKRMRFCRCYDDV